MNRIAIRDEAETLFAAFKAAGAVAVESDTLLPAETLLDLYGEDIRARAYVTNDPLQGEMMLRPDFTVPVVQVHMQGGADPARYCYLGEVFRKQDRPGARASEYLQVGFELFDRDAPEAADAEVFALFHKLLSPLGLVAVTGDIGILMAAVKGLSTSPCRKAALLRHIWRPARFRKLLDRFSGRAALPEARIALLDRLRRGDMPSAPMIGLRAEAEIMARSKSLLEDAETPLLAAPEAALLYDLLTLQAPARAALSHLRGITGMLPAIEPAVDRFATRLDALERHGINPSDLAFEASHGRSSMEYYDGFVFSFHDVGGRLGDGSAVALGGRYDALTARLGNGKSIPAVGGIIRPALVASLRKAGI